MGCKCFREVRLETRNMHFMTPARLIKGFPSGSVVKNPPAVQLTKV